MKSKRILLLGLSSTLLFLAASGEQPRLLPFPKGQVPFHARAGGPAAAPLQSAAKGLNIPCLAGTIGTKAYGNPSLFWSKNTLTVRFLDGDSVQQNMVKKAVQVWTQVANIKFLWITNGNADIRISFLGK